MDVGSAMGHLFGASPAQLGTGDDALGQRSELGEGVSDQVDLSFGIASGSFTVHLTVASLSVLVMVTTVPNIKRGPARVPGAAS